MEVNISTKNVGNVQNEIKESKNIFTYEDWNVHTKTHTHLGNNSTIYWKKLQLKLVFKAPYTFT